jgi:hypothetical protein
LLRWVRLDDLICEYSQVAGGGRVLCGSPAAAERSDETLFRT